MNCQMQSSTDNKLKKGVLITSGVIACVSLLILLCYIFDIDLFGRRQGFDTTNHNNEKNVADLFSTNDHRIDDYVEGDIILESIENDKRDYLDEGHLEGIGSHTLKCSKSCCGSDWPVPPELLEYDDVYGHDFVRTNLNCANGVGGSGCVCMPRVVRKVYERRGGFTEPEFI